MIAIQARRQQVDEGGCPVVLPEDKPLVAAAFTISSSTSFEQHLETHCQPTKQTRELIQRMMF
jgi:hypothetical protein